MAEDAPKKTLRDVLAIVRVRQRLFLLIVAAVALGVLVYWHTVELEYTGTTRFRRFLTEAARSGRSRDTGTFENLKLGLAQDLAGRNAIEQVVTELGLDRGPEYERNEQGEFTRKGKKARQELVRDIKEKVTIRFGEESREWNEIAVQVTHSDPNLAQQLPNALVKNYIDSTGAEVILSLQRDKDFLEQRVTNCKEDLAGLEAKRIDFEVEHREAMPENPGAIQHAIDQIDDELLRLRRDGEAAGLRHLAAKKKLEQMLRSYPALVRLAKAGETPTTQPTTQPVDNQPATQPTTRPGELAPGASRAIAAATQPTSAPAEQPLQIHKAPNPELQRLKSQLAEQEDLLTNFRIVQRMKDSHPKIKAVLAKIEQLKQQIEKTPERIVVREVYAGGQAPTDGTLENVLEPMVILAYQDADFDLRAAQQEVERIEADMEPLKKRKEKLDELMLTLRPTQQKYAEICEQVRECSKELEGWKSKDADVKQKLAAEVAKRRLHHEVTQAAEPQFLPSSPNPMKVLASSIGLALALAAGLTYLANMVDRRINTKEDARQYAAEQLGGVEIHGVIGEILTPKKLRAQWFRRWIFAPPVYAVITASVLIAAFSILLKLGSPDGFKEWSSDPVPYVQERVGELITTLGDKLQSLL